MFLSSKEDNPCVSGNSRELCDYRHSNFSAEVLINIPTCLLIELILLYSI